MLVLQAVVLFLTGVVTIGMTDLGAGAVARRSGLGLAAALRAGRRDCSAGRVGYAARAGLVQVVSIALGFVVTRRCSSSAWCSRRCG